MEINQKEILDALIDEERVNKGFAEYMVTTINYIDGKTYAVTLKEKAKEERNIFSRKIQIDEIMIGGKIWWEVDKTSGYAEIFLVVPDEEKIVFRFLNGPLPKINTTVRIYLPNYIRPLIDCWRNNEYVSLIREWIKDVQNYKHKIKKYEIKGYYKSWLRTNQKEAFNLLDMKAGLLWGPPGTGKTTTTGAMIAEYIIKNPYDTILIVGNTNLAVDTIFTSFDKILDNFSEKNLIRKKCVRYGGAFLSRLYNNREYLITKNDNEYLLKELFILEEEKTKIPEGDIKSLTLWQEKYDMLKRQLKNSLENILQNRTIVAMTSTAIFNQFETMINNRFDLVILEEASQINLCQALMLTILGDKVIFTGDDKQLSPIVLSKNKKTCDYLGRSIFSLKHSVLRNKVFFLNEQSRMTRDICKIVSETFYNGQLILAKHIPKIDDWKKERHLYDDDMFKGKEIVIIDIDEKSTWSQKYNGLIRFESGEEIVDICCNLIDHRDTEKEEINILTPFRAQKNLIKGMLRHNCLSEIKVNTVHKSQGSECHTIIFDPVDGTSNFLNTQEAEHLINVAISRAKARLIICLHKEDYYNYSLRKIATLIANMSNSVDKNSVQHIKDFVNHREFPNNVVNKILDFEKAGVLKVLEINESKKYMLTAYPNKVSIKKKISLEFLYKKYGKV